MLTRLLAAAAAAGLAAAQTSYARSATCYAKRYPDLKHKFCKADGACNAPQAMAHFRDHGLREGRLFGCDDAGEDTNLDTVFDGKLMIMHMPKSGGTTFRSVVFRRARSMKKSLQTYYGHDSIGFDRFDRKHPADVVMGHSVTLNTLQPVPSGLRVRYTTMLRSPYAWYVSLSRAGANFFGRRGFGWADRVLKRSRTLD